MGLKHSVKLLPLTHSKPSSAGQHGAVWTVFRSGALVVRCWRRSQTRTSKANTSSWVSRESGPGLNPPTETCHYNFGWRLHPNPEGACFLELPHMRQDDQNLVRSAALLRFPPLWVAHRDMVPLNPNANQTFTRVQTRVGNSARRAGPKEFRKGNLCSDFWNLHSHMPHRACVTLGGKNGSVFLPQFYPW